MSALPVMVTGGGPLDRERYSHPVNGQPGYVRLITSGTRVYSAAAFPAAMSIEFSTVTADATPDPNGGSSTFKIAADTTPNVHHGLGAANLGTGGGATLVDNVDFTCHEIKVMAGTINVVAVYVGELFAWFDLTTGVRLLGDSRIRIMPYGAAPWWRIYTVGIPWLAAALRYVLKVRAVKGGSDTFTGSAADYFYAFGYSGDILRGYQQPGYVGMPLWNGSFNPDIHSNELGSLATPQAMTIFLPWIDQGNKFRSGARGILRVGDALGTAEKSINVTQTATQLIASYTYNGRTVTSSVAFNPDVFDLGGAALRISDQGAIRLSCFINASAWVDGSWTDPIGLPPAWSDSLVFVGSLGNSAYGDMLEWLGNSDDDLSAGMTMLPGTYWPNSMFHDPLAPADMGAQVGEVRQFSGSPPSARWVLNDGVSLLAQSSYVALAAYYLASLGTMPPDFPSVTQMTLPNTAVMTRSIYVSSLGLFIMATTKGMYYTADAETVPTLATGTTTSDSFNWVHFDGTRLLAVGDSGKFYSSTNGTSWTAETIASLSGLSLKQIVHDGTKWVINVGNTAIYTASTYNGTYTSVQTITLTTSAISLAANPNTGRMFVLNATTNQVGYSDDHFATITYPTLPTVPTQVAASVLGSVTYARIGTVDWVYVNGSLGRALVSQDNGATWADVRFPQITGTIWIPPVYTGLELVGAFATNLLTLYTSYDRLTTKQWKPVLRPHGLDYSTPALQGWGHSFGGGKFVWMGAASSTYYAMKRTSFNTATQFVVPYKAPDGAGYSYTYAGTS